MAIESIATISGFCDSNGFSRSVILYYQTEVLVFGIALRDYGLIRKAHIFFFSLPYISNHMVRFSHVRASPCLLAWNLHAASYLDRHFECLSLIMVTECTPFAMNSGYFSCRMYC